MHECQCHSRASSFDLVFPQLFVFVPHLGSSRSQLILSNLQGTVDRKIYLPLFLGEEYLLALRLFQNCSHEHFANCDSMCRRQAIHRPIPHRFLRHCSH